MSRKDTSAARQGPNGRRPLLVTFDGNNRQMLNEIRDSLSHLRKNDVEAQYSEHLLHPPSSGGQFKHDLSQSTPNLLGKSNGSAGGQANKMTRRDTTHHETLAVIRDSLRPYQTDAGCTTNGVPALHNGTTGGGGGSDNSSVASSTSSYATSSDPEPSPGKVAAITKYGFDEDLAVRALKLSNYNPEGALRLLDDIIKRTTSGLPVYSMAPRSAFGPSSPAASETNSVRSDSPGLIAQHRQQQQHRPHLMTNGMQTPPPLPPRAPITSGPAHVASQRGQTPPPSSEAAIMSQQSLASQPGPALLQQVSQHYYGKVGQALIGTANHQPVSGGGTVVPQGHVQQMIQLINPSQPAYFQDSQGTVTVSGASAKLPLGGGLVHQHQHHLQGYQRGLQSPVGGASSSSPSPLLAQQLQSLILGSPASPSPPSSSSSPGRFSQQTPQAPPPPYSQAQAQIQAARLGAMAGLSSPGPSSLGSDSTPSLLDVSVLPEQHKTKMVASTAVSATRMPMSSNHIPVIMPSVRSKEVTKPMPQTATAPVAPPSSNIALQTQHLNINGSMTSQHNSYVSQLQAQINSHHNHHHNFHHQQHQLHQQQQLKQTGLSIVVGQQQPKLTPRAITSAMAQRREATGQMEEGSAAPVQAHVNSVVPQLLRNGSPGLSSDHLAALAAASGAQPTTGSGRQPMVRANGAAGLYRQIHVQDPPGSESSIPSTNSDIPDKPPPPYPGRGPPVLPPRRPIKQPPPPPPNDQKVISQHAQNFKVPSSMFSASFPSPSPSIASASPIPSSPSSAASVQAPVPPSRSPPPPETSTPPSETDETDTDASSVSASVVGETKAGNPQQETMRCLSPLPQRKSEARERDRLRCDTKVRIYSPQAFKFYMEQHVENVLKSHTQRMNRRMQLEKEMAKVELSEEAARQMRKMLHQKESNYIRLKRAKMDPCMFDKIKTLGVGAFGEVALVRKKDVGSLYAMKTLTKSNVIKRNQVAHVKAERDILAEADNEWVVKLYYSFQDEQNLYFVMDYVPGGDLMGQLIRKEILDEHLARFYIAELVLAIESVHRMGFIHRDIKPDNILIDRDGHIKLTDFGLCTGFRWTHNSKYYQKGYTKVCDWWSVGVILYEMVIGQPPFYANTPLETQYKVIHWKDTLNMQHCGNISVEAQDLIRQLLQGPESRLGRHGAQEIKQHAFFASINFEGLRRQPAPEKPTIRFLTDTSNFDPVDPDKLRTNDSDAGSKKAESKTENGKHPEHAFFEFTFRRFFDDGGHPCSLPSTPSPSQNQQLQLQQQQQQQHPEQESNNSPVYV
ncbi:hypothetical protein EGW08_011106 [Elysia chlorotica]|uniref:non-specific serine/threonine protein kinase n=1 Tax=Elysia chlorotica TaxID=188477 RepID=A0A3S0ZKP3_ELYCH|nr:hypothetical protein EGW08_011106 [Elysia chlorotica]